MRFNTAFKRALSDSGLTVVELSKQLKKTKSYIYKLLSGEEFPSEKFLRKVMSIIQFPPDYSADIDLILHDKLPGWIATQCRSNAAFRDRLRGFIETDLSRTNLASPAVFVNSEELK